MTILNKKEIKLQEIFDNEAESLLASPGLKKSPTLSRLFVYLIESTKKGDIPKEVSIAIDVFNKPETYDSASDSFVRVNVLNLRKRINEYYSSLDTPVDYQLLIPKGSYEVILTPCKNETVETPKRPAIKPETLRKSFIALLVVALISSIALNIWQRTPVSVSTVEQSDSLNNIWSTFSSSKKHTYLILGDTYLYSLTDEYNSRLTVRHEGINSDAEFELFSRRNPEAKVSHSFKRLLQKSIAYALPNLINTLNNQNINFTISTLSDLEPNNMRDANFIFIGIFKAKGFLNSYFNSFHSNCLNECNMEFTSLSGDKYRPHGALIVENTDYGVVSRINRDNGTTGLFLLGYSDSGLRQASRAVTLDSEAKPLVNSFNNLTKKDSFEAVYEVDSYNFTGYKSTLVSSTKTSK